MQGCVRWYPISLQTLVLFSSFLLHPLRFSSGIYSLSTSELSLFHHPAPRYGAFSLDFVGCGLIIMDFLDDNVRSPMKECKANDFGPHEGRKRMIIGFYEWAKNETFKNWLSALYGGFDGRQWLWVGRMTICMVVGGEGGEGVFSVPNIEAVVSVGFHSSSPWINVFPE